jgi:hypothetical protein
MLPESDRAAFAISLDPALLNLYLEQSLQLARDTPIDDRMSRSELRDAICRLDAAAALTPKPKSQPRLDDLSPSQLRRLATATSQAEADQLLDAFASERNG